MLCTFLCIYMPKTFRLQIQTMHNTDPQLCPGTTRHISWSDKWQSRKRKKQTILLYGFAIRNHLLILMLLPLTQFYVLKSISITLRQAPPQMVTWVCWGKSASGPSTRPASQETNRSQQLKPLGQATTQNVKLSPRSLVQCEIQRFFCFKMCLCFCVCSLFICLLFQCLAPCSQFALKTLMQQKQQSTKNMHVDHNVQSHQMQFNIEKIEVQQAFCPNVLTRCQKTIVL